MKPFELEAAISEWREQMQTGGVRNREVLDELEGHLREDVIRQIKTGTEEQVAFETAVRQIGSVTALKTEFRKIGAGSRMAARVSRATLAFAGIPNFNLEDSMNDSSLEPRWATYLRSAVFLGPALALWVLASTFVLPKLNELWMKAGSAGAHSSFDQIRMFDTDVMAFFHNYFLYLVGALVLALGLLEMRSRIWPRFRRASLGTVVFLFNVMILLSLFIQFLAATLVASWFVPHVK